MILKRYGGPRQEFRAYLATVLVGWAQSVHFAATMDMARELTKLQFGRADVVAVAQAAMIDEVERYCRIGRPVHALKVLRAAFAAASETKGAK